MNAMCIFNLLLFSLLEYDNIHLIVHVGRYTTLWQVKW